eukprot:g5873.t1
MLRFTRTPLNRWNFRRVGGTAAFSAAPSQTFLSGNNSVYIESMHDAWARDPSSVHASWATYFQQIESGVAPSAAMALPPDLQVGQPAMPSATQVVPATSDSTRILHLISSYQNEGHKAAKLDPLGLSVVEPFSLPALDPATYGFVEEDWERPLDLSGFGVEGCVGLFANSDVNNDGQTTLRELVDFLQKTYCGTVGFEYSHIAIKEKVQWLQERIEVVPEPADAESSMKILDRLARSDKFERFLALKFNTMKRFGVEGCDTLTVGLKAMVDQAVDDGVEDVIIGMPHRGRLNVLVNVVNKPMEVVVSEFQGTNVPSEDDWAGSGDVKYHLGTSCDRVYPDGRSVHCHLLPNPSHLETVNPIVNGKARSKMDKRKDRDGTTVLPVSLHGDAAIAGQGIVYETMQFCKVPSFQTGGTMHVICNNQVGFTTNPIDSRSTRYSSDIGKAFCSPIFHVNADDAAEVARVFKLAAQYRAKFRCDVIVDLIGYRRYGHNEQDQPMYTQPLMYQVVQKHPPALDMYKSKLVKEGVLTQEAVDELMDRIDNDIKTSFERADSGEFQEEDTWGQRNWQNFKRRGVPAQAKPTSASKDLINRVASYLGKVPEGFTMHRQLAKLHKQKVADLESGKGFDWAIGEALAFGSLMLEGFPVRLSGQDVQRGTFSHRHAVVHDQGSDSRHCFLNQMAEEVGDSAGTLHACNSPLSEYGVLGYELGYSMENPNALVLWEAQFGDFANGAQIIIDQYLASMETKWKRQTGLVLLLPHGYQGMGPEHSSCRIERFLQLTDDDPDNVTEGTNEEIRQQVNWQVANPTTPANYFHLLRRQVHSEFRKPLIVASTKALLRHKLAVSDADEFSDGFEFAEVMGDESCPEGLADHLKSDDAVRRVVCCSGKLYYELVEKRAETGIDDVALIRLEQLSPFPFAEVAEQLSKYPNAEVVWAQEEPKNQGPWQFVQDRLATASRVLNNKEISPGYVGRQTMAATAGGYGSVHEKEQADIIQNALGDNCPAHSRGSGRLK